jgi:hypothetical protein
MKIEDFSKNITANLQDNNKNYSFDIGLIVTIGYIIISIIQLLMKCNVFGRKLEDRIKNPGPIDQILLRRAIKNNLPKKYYHLRDQIKDQILLNVKTLSNDEIKTMVMEAKNARQD